MSHRVSRPLTTLCVCWWVWTWCGQHSRHCRATGSLRSPSVHFPVLRQGSSYKIAPRFWFSDSPQDSLKTALLQFVNKNSMTKIGFAQALSTRGWDELVDAYFVVGVKCKCPMCDILNILWTAKPIKIIDICFDACQDLQDPTRKLKKQREYIIFDRLPLSKSVISKIWQVGVFMI